MLQEFFHFEKILFVDEKRAIFLDFIRAWNRRLF
jgi:hypothetical protein